MNKDDLEIWKDFKAGSESAFCFIYDTYFSVLYAYGRKFTNDKDLVLDSVQDVFLELVRKRDKLSDTNNIKFYLMRSLRRRIGRKVKLKGFLSEELLLDDPLFFIDLSGLPEIRLSEFKQQLINLKNAVKELPVRQKEVIFLKFYFRYSNSEIADIMDVNYQSVANHLQKAIHNLKAKLEISNVEYSA